MGWEGLGRADYPWASSPGHSLPLGAHRLVYNTVHCPPGYTPYKVTYASDYFDQLYAWSLLGLSCRLRPQYGPRQADQGTVMPGIHTPFLIGVRPMCATSEEEEPQGATTHFPHPGETVPQRSRCLFERWRSGGVQLGLSGPECRNEMPSGLSCSRMHSRSGNAQV